MQVYLAARSFAIDDQRTNCYHNFQVVVSGALDYSDPKIQRDMEELLTKLENTTYIDPLYTESWLRSFLDYVDKWKDYPDYFELKVDDEQNFIHSLKNVSSNE